VCHLFEVAIANADIQNRGTGKSREILDSADNELEPRVRLLEYVDGAILKVRPNMLLRRFDAHRPGLQRDI
jgi:hypothetical protein